MKLLKLTLVAICLLFVAQCKKESQNTGSSTPADIKPESKEYVRFDVEGISGLSSFVFQDADGYSFKGYHDRCPLSPTYVLHETKKAVDPDNNPRFSIFFGTASQPSRFKDGIKVKQYSVKDLSDGNAMIGFCHNKVNDGGLCASTMNNNTGNKFEISKIETVDGIEYALGSFTIYAHTPAPNNTTYFWIKNGKFRIKL